MSFDEFKKNLGGRPPIYNEPDELLEPAYKYFGECVDVGKIPTIAGLSNALNMTRKTLHDYGKKDKFCYTVNRLRTIIEEAWENALIGGGAGAIFWNKVNAGYEDKTVVDENLNIKTGKIIAYIPENGRVNNEALFTKEDPQAREDQPLRY